MKKVVLLVGLLVCSGAWAGIPNNSIESNLKQCVSEDTSASGGVTLHCTNQAIKDYEKFFKRNNFLDGDSILQYISVSKACEQPYVSKPIPPSSADEGDIARCQLDVARNFMKVGEFLKKSD